MAEQKSWAAYNPANGSVFAEGQQTPLDQIQPIFERSHLAFQAWSTLSLDARLGYMRQFRLHLVEHLDESVKAVTDSTGKVPMEALTNEVLPVLHLLEYLEKNAKKQLVVQPKPTPFVLQGKSSHVEYSPRGVVVVISPNNYPFHLALVPVLHALTAGNSVILKVSETVPYMGEFLEGLFYQVGFPEGVVQVVHGDGAVGKALIDAEPDYLFFTGSDLTGRKIAAQAGAKLIPYTLELGGKDPMIVFADAPLGRAVRGAAWGGFTNNGQVCMSVERLYVEATILDDFVERLVDFCSGLVQGTDADADLGSMTTREQVEVLRELIEDALHHGAELRLGQPPSEWDLESGLFVKPMILTNVTQKMRIMQEEAFGPVLPIMAFDNERQAVELANDSAFGLNASVWSSDLEKAQRTATRLVVGGVLINDVILTVANPHLPFGGAKASGIGRYQGDNGLRIFCHEKAVMVDRGRRPAEPSWFPYKGKYGVFRRLCRALFGRMRHWPSLAFLYIKLKRFR